MRLRLGTGASGLILRRFTGEVRERAIPLLVAVAVSRAEPPTDLELTGAMLDE